jgi:hypothetical protein
MVDRERVRCFCGLKGLLRTKRRREGGETTGGSGEAVDRALVFFLYHATVWEGT